MNQHPPEWSGKVNSDLKADVPSLSFSVDLARNGVRQDFSMQNATTLPINDATAFLATMKVMTASNPAAGLWSVPFRDKLRVLRTLVLAQVQSPQTIKPYQQLRYWSTVPFRHGPIDAVKYSATPSPDNPAHPLKRNNPNALKDELIRHLEEDSVMSRFDFGLQFLDVDRMTYWGKRQEANFWIENASVQWNEEEAPFHTVGQLTLCRDPSSMSHGTRHPTARPLGASIAPAGLGSLPAEKPGCSRIVKPETRELAP